MAWPGGRGVAVGAWAGAEGPGAAGLGVRAGARRGEAGRGRAGRGAAVVATKREGGDLPQLTKTRPPDAGFARFEIGSDSAQIAFGKKNRCGGTATSAGLQAELGDQLVYSTFSYAK